mmetsp:Transcript_8661/g.22405  ORF Transcript_8661/g.22405 Transcript_8661/m.22405 type:complete len:222 (+) Transcript_8661:166-831(+)
MGSTRQQVQSCPTRVGAPMERPDAIRARLPSGSPKAAASVVTPAPDRALGSRTLTSVPTFPSRPTQTSCSTRSTAPRTSTRCTDPTRTFGNSTLGEPRETPRCTIRAAWRGVLRSRSSTRGSTTPPDTPSRGTSAASCSLGPPAPCGVEGPSSRPGGSNRPTMAAGISSGCAPRPSGSPRPASSGPHSPLPPKPTPCGTLTRARILSSTRPLSRWEAARVG